MGTAAATGCPAHLQTTYDYLGLDAYPHVTYNAVLHLAAMRATARLAALAGDGSSLAADAAASEAACAAALGPRLWAELPGGGGFWRAYQNEAGDAPDAILSGFVSTAQAKRTRQSQLRFHRASKAHPAEPGARAKARPKPQPQTPRTP
jgi:hypothetical protein